MVYVYKDARIRLVQNLNNDMKLSNGIIGTLRYVLLYEDKQDQIPYGDNVE
jgi:hypothetical protein